MRMCSIASGSSGNCIYVGSDTTHLLIDTGISGKRVEAGVNSLDLDMRDIDAVLVTHEHADHISGLGVLARKYSIPIYCTRGTRDAILQDPKCGTIDEDLFEVIAADEKYVIKDLNIHPFHISHDAADPVAYRICHGKQKCAVCTDLGVYNDYIIDNLRGLDAVLLEANHDVHMLEVGPYPYPLKRRILGERGHLSNESSGKLLCNILHDDMKAIVLGHLSQQNNLPELAFETVRMEVAMADVPYTGSDFPLYVAHRKEVSDVIEIA
ncbi:MAG: MBL fold metallo-hydrolase [Lachnospiraceae bacterium]|nr:MBL fold metallo-hydrolase [Lachnospiraceae bacterium]